MLRRTMARLYPPPEIKFPAKFINQPKNFVLLQPKSREDFS